MRVLITGANGFLGRQLAREVLNTGTLRGRAVERLLLLDTRFDELPHDPRVRAHPGSITDAALLRRVLADGVEVVFHLVSVPGGAAEQNYALGLHVNLLAGLELLDQLRNPVRPPVVVYASSVAVYGANLPSRMNEDAVACPQSSYAAHNLMMETALCDLARRGEVDGRALRLPGIVARPQGSNGLRTAFMSDVLHACAAGQNYICPVSPQAKAWWMSAPCAVANLLHAAQLSDLPWNTKRVWQLPVLQLSMAQVLDALAGRFGESCRELISFAPDPHLQALFGALPAMKTPRSKAAGFCHDGSAASLVRKALNLPAARKHL
ncbi:NAD-dependent epimerase/dehydratase family protein [Pseudomonas sp. CFBP 13719]|uniref:NAD-dependent epimerase/dehydratase family protein n=1 Tax=Pseudomonas sp. CFBP 13719 TaxID=2775303 RepID=UPI00177CE58F|nr:NAD-dependent epimerase/dehydratase family protein [Pseudomonas sp. CFBP 13719]MBD8682513.1 NAD-dependent epimerase/dehydratase family protein [Pseudomonas sp. CFBP 13719]